MNRDQFKAEANTKMIEKAAKSANLTIRKGEVENQRGALIDRIFNVQEAAFAQKKQLAGAKINVTEKLLQKTMGKFPDPDKGRVINIQEKTYQNFFRQKEKIKTGDWGKDTNLDIQKKTLKSIEKTLGAKDKDNVIEIVVQKAFDKIKAKKDIVPTTATVKDYASKIASKIKLDITMKSGSQKLKGIKTGKYNYYTVLRAGLADLFQDASDGITIDNEITL